MRVLLFLYFVCGSSGRNKNSMHLQLKYDLCVDLCNGQYRKTNMLVCMKNIEFSLHKTKQSKVFDEDAISSFSPCGHCRPGGLCLQRNRDMNSAGTVLFKKTAN